MSGPAGCEVIGHWRIVASDLWDREYLDLAGPAYCRSVLRAGPSLALVQSTPAPNSNTAAALSFFTGAALTRAMVGGDGSAELQDDGSLEIELSFDDGDDAILTAHREMTSSTAC
jgi:hypothetical protein